MYKEGFSLMAYISLYGLKRVLCRASVLAPAHKAKEKRRKSEKELSKLLKVFAEVCVGRRSRRLSAQNDFLICRRCEEKTIREYRVNRKF